MSVQTPIRPTRPAGEHPRNGQGPPQHTPAGPDTPDLSREYGQAFARLFPVLVIFIGLGILATVAVWARNASNEPAPARPGRGATNAGGYAVEVGLAEMSIAPQMIHVPAGRATVLHVTNSGQTQHGFAMQGPNGVIQVATIDPGASADLRLPALPAGTYQAWCPVPGHRDAGMTATVMAMPMDEGGTAGSGSSDASGLGDGMSAAEMARMHAASMKAFPAKTAGLGGRVLQPRVVGGVKVFELTASQVRWEVAPGQFETALAYNHEVPGPQIRVHQGDRVRIVLHNDSPQPTTIHFHGLTVPNADDGVPYVTQDPVMPGETFTYAFKVVNAPGTYMYHSHFNSLEQVSRGLYGAFVVEPARASWDEEYTMILGDGPLGYTIDGKGWPATSPLVAHMGDDVLIRLSNMGSMLHPMHLHGFHFKVLDQDGAPLRHPYSADTIVVAPGETFDVLVHADQPGIWAFHCHILSHVEGPQGMFGMATALVVQA
jgi:uncharacterized cupredoxin-like copper-binding protein